MQNATTPGITPPPIAPAPPIPSMPMGYAAPQMVRYVPPSPMYPMYSTPTAKAVNNVGGALVTRGLELTLTVLLLLMGVYLFFKTGPGKDLLSMFKWLGPIVEAIGVLTGVGYLYKYGSRAGFFGKAKKAEQLAEDAKTAREAGDIEKAKKLEKEAQEAKAEAKEAEEAAKLAKETKEAEEAAKLAKETKEAKEVANLLKF